LQVQRGIAAKVRISPRDEPDGFVVARAALAIRLLKQMDAESSALDRRRKFYDLSSSGGQVAGLQLQEQWRRRTFAYNGLLMER
jgi:hypothetical protein